MKDIISYIKEKQKEYRTGSSAYNILRHLETTLPSLFPSQPSDQKPPEPFNVKGTEEIHRNCLRLLEEKMGEKWYFATGATHNCIVEAMQEYAQQSRQQTRIEAIQECMSMVSAKIGLHSDVVAFIYTELEKLKNNRESSL